MGIGHVRQRCPSDIDRSGSCFNCGGADHQARNCRNRACCPVCKERGYPYAHRAGSDACRPTRRLGGAVRRTAEENPEGFAGELQNQY
ncbi:hypothetical protein ALC60_11697 [Trachymyrmex zeteki]|uniref:CCHC-type domain-containing protein n=1 Tax=Mycetomoellerius zeteki TaxID=64791 RepID=A0A151WN48_9HYME|nr:hypothetical protein ALC60_11697 [Trachymyrmex zeteki]